MLSTPGGWSIGMGSVSGEANCSSGPALLLGDAVEPLVDADCASANAPSTVDVVDIGGVGSVAAAVEGDRVMIRALGGAGSIASKSCGRVASKDLLVRVSGDVGLDIRMDREDFALGCIHGLDGGLGHSGSQVPQVLLSLLFP